jgi:hypothetical protein
MLLKNLDTANGLTNGARGVVVGFNDEEEYKSFAEDASSDRGGAHTGMPVVRINLPDGTTNLKLITPANFEIEEKDRQMMEKSFGGPDEAKYNKI